MTRPRSTTSQADELGATLANNKARLSSVELMAHSHDQLARGIVGYNERITTQSPISTGLTSIISLPVRTDAGRAYKVTAACNLWKEGSANWVNVYIYQDGAQIQRLGRSFLSAGYDDQYHGTTVIYPAAGLHTYEIRVQFEANTLNQARAAVDNPTFLLIEDIGPAFVLP